jgi:hypothetical protein
MFDALTNLPAAAPLPKFAVAMPEAGAGAYLLMDFPALEELERHLGDDYWMVMQSGFRGSSTLIISRALAVCLCGAEPDAAPWGLSLQELGRRLYDAQIRVLKGITLEEAETAIAESAT